MLNFTGSASLLNAGKGIQQKYKISRTFLLFNNLKLRYFRFSVLVFPFKTAALSLRAWLNGFFVHKYFFIAFLPSNCFSQLITQQSTTSSESHQSENQKSPLAAALKTSIQLFASI
jgi:hypothetical protein